MLPAPTSTTDLAALTLADAVSALAQLLPPDVELVLRRATVPHSSGGGPVLCAACGGAGGDELSGQHDPRDESPEARERRLARERTKRWRERHAVSPSVTPTVTADVTGTVTGDAVTVTPSVTERHADRHGDAVSVTQRHMGGVGGGKQASKLIQDSCLLAGNARASDAPSPTVTDRHGVTVTPGPSRTVTPAVTVGFSAEMLAVAKALPIPSTMAEARWRELANGGQDGLSLVNGEIRLADTTAKSVFQGVVQQAAQAHTRGRADHPWLYALPVYQDQYRRARVATDKLRAATAAPAAPPPHVLQEREAKARWDALTPEQQAAENAQRQAQLEALLKRRPREVPDAA